LSSQQITGVPRDKIFGEGTLRAARPCTRGFRLFADLDLAHGDGRFARLFRMLVAPGDDRSRGKHTKGAKK
jgi:hypothetical protein